MRRPEGRKGEAGVEIREGGFWCSNVNDRTSEAAVSLLGHFRSRGVNVSVEGRLSSVRGFEQCKCGFDSCDLLITFGGDGTLLSGLQYALRGDVPVLGINMGHVGFLTELEPDDMEKCVDRLISGQYTLEERMLLEADVGGQPMALNDATVTRAPSLRRILTLEVYINGLLAESFSGDGLIISTPTGSTAYSFAAGGPVVQPDMELLLLTPICPHTLNTRPMVAPADALIEVVPGRGNEAVLTMDGKSVHYLGGGERIVLKRSERRARFIHLNDQGFYDRLRSKLMDWGH